MKSFVTPSAFENVPNAGKWIAGGVGLLLLLALSFATFGGGSSVEPHLREPLPRPVDDDRAVILLTKLANDVEALKRTVETYTWTSSGGLPAAQPVEERPAIVSGLPPAWERITSRRQFLDKYELGGRNFDGVHFEGVDFSGMNLGPISFQDSTFKSCSFERTTVYGQFNRAKLYKVRFDRTVFQSVSFESALLDECSFDRITIDGGQAAFKNARLLSTTFRKAALSQALFDNATIEHGDFAGVLIPPYYGLSTFYGSTIIKTDLSSLGNDPVDFKAAFCRTKQLLQVSLARLRVRFPFVPGDNTKVDWQGCMGSDGNLTMTISESDFREVTVVPPNDPWSANQPLLTVKEYLSQIARVDDKCLF